MNTNAMKVLLLKAKSTGHAAIEGTNTSQFRGAQHGQLAPLQERFTIDWSPSSQIFSYWGKRLVEINQGVCIYIAANSVADTKLVHNFLYLAGIDRYKVSYKTSSDTLVVEDTMQNKTFTGSDEINKHFDYVASYYPKKDIKITTEWQTKDPNGRWINDGDMPIVQWIDRPTFERSFVKERWDDERRYNYSYHKQGYYHTKTIVLFRDSDGTPIRRTVRNFDFEAREQMERQWNNQLQTQESE